MKRFIQFYFLLLIFVTSVKAQISVTASDYEAQVEIGKQVTTYRDGTTTSVDIGSPGASSWDFTSFVASNQFVTESKDVNSSPYASDFAGAEYASNYEGTFDGTMSNTWVYNTINNNYLSHGTGTVANTASGNVTTVITFDPAVVEYQLPVEYQSTWTYEGQQTIATTITVPFVGDQTTTITQQRKRVFTVDGYGVITMPDGKNLNALRIREENTLTGDNVNTFSVLYHFITKTGESVSLTLADGVTDNSGVVSVSAVSWTSGDGTGIVQVTLQTPTSLNATTSSNQIDLSWTDNSDNEDGFNVERAEGSGDFTQIAQVSADANSYSDMNVQTGVEYHYRIQAYSGNSTSDYSNTTDASITATALTDLSSEIPNSYKLSQNYPNPFNPSTQIQFSIPQSGFVTLKVYDVLGNEVANLVEQNLTSGNYSVDFNASKLSSGIYFYSLKTNSFAEIKKMMLLK